MADLGTVAKIDIFLADYRPTATCPAQAAATYHMALIRKCYRRRHPVAVNRPTDGWHTRGKSNELAGGNLRRSGALAAARNASRAAGWLLGKSFRMAYATEPKRDGFQHFVMPESLCAPSHLRGGCMAAAAGQLHRRKPARARRQPSRRRQPASLRARWNARRPREACFVSAHQPSGQKFPSLRAYIHLAADWLLRRPTHGHLPHRRAV